MTYFYASNSKEMPTINLDNCIKCQKCVNDCPSDAINIELGTINEMCIHCGHCVAICPESTISPDNIEVTKLKTHLVSAEDFQKFTAQVRTCRSYQDKEVPAEVLDQLVENMKHYPSASNARPVEITIVKSEELVKSLNDQTANKLIKTLGLATAPIIRNIFSLFSSKATVDGLSKYRKKFVEKQVEGSSQVCHHAPIVMIFHAPVSKYGMADSDAYIWSTYTSLYANSLGLGTCFNGFIVNAMQRSKAMRKEFKIPKNNTVYASLLIGYSKVEYKNEVGRERPTTCVI